MNTVMPVPVPVKIEHKVLEKHVEKYLYNKMKKLGGECYKWSSMNLRGVTDRICMFPDGQVWFVELKKDKKAKLSVHQAKFFKRMVELQVTDCIVLHGKKEVDEWLTKLGY